MTHKWTRLTPGTGDSECILVAQPNVGTPGTFVAHAHQENGTIWTAYGSGVVMTREEITALYRLVVVEEVPG
jgi:hypothetical protein